MKSQYCAALALALALSLSLSVGGSTALANEAQTQSLVYSQAQDLESGHTISLSLDLYLPRGIPHGDRPIAIFAHGLGSDKDSAMASYWCNEQFVAHGWACASINYRTTRAGGVGLAKKAALSDMLAAIRWVHAHAAQYRLDPARVVAIGVSGGATIALGAGIAGNNPDSPFFNGPAINKSNSGASAKLAYSIAISGRIDPSIREALLDAQDPPSLMYHGEADSIIPYDSAVDTADALRAAGVRVKLLSFPGADHSLGRYREKIASDIWISLKGLEAPLP